MFDMLPLLPMACGDASEPRKTIPRSFLWSFGIVAANALLLTIIVGCNAPGVSYFALPEVNAFSYGYAKGLHITRRAARLLGIPASIVLWALSGLGHTAGLFIEMIILVSFLRFRKHLSSLPRMFTQPVGPILAYYSLAMFLAYVCCMLNFYPRLIMMYVLFAIYLIFLTIWYFWQVNSKQVFSLLEQKVMFQAYVINANATRRRRKRQALPTPTSSNTRIPSVLLRANHAQHGYLDRLSGAAAYVSRMFRIRSNVTFTANLPTGTAIVKKREQKRDDNSYRGYTPEDNAKSERHARQPEGEQNATTAVHATYDKDSLFSISSELIDSQVRNHPTLDYQSKRHQRGLPCYQIAPDNAMVEHVCTLPWQDVLDVVD
eukprot:gene7466-8254_t